MPSIGELFIQLAVMGNANELKNANKELQKANILTQKQAKLDKLRAEALERIQKAQTKQEKREIAKQYRAKKEKIEQEANLRLKNLEAKATQKSIAQWSTYAHAVSMASSIVVGSLKKVYDEIEKVTSYGQNMINIGMTTSTPLGELQSYGRVAHALNPQASEQQVMSMMAKLNQAYDFYKAGNPEKLLSTMNLGELAQLGASGIYSDVLSGKVPNATAFLESVRQAIQGQNPERQSNILRAAGLDDSLLPMLRMSSDEFQKYAAELQRDALSESQLKEQAEIKRRLNVFVQHFEDFKLRVFGKLSPLLEDIMKEIDNNLPSILSWVEETAKYFRENIKKEDIKAIINLTKSIAEYLGKVVVFWAKFFGEEDKSGQEKINREALDGVFYDAETNKFYPGIAGADKETLKYIEYLNNMKNNNMNWDYINSTMNKWLHNNVDYQKLYQEGWAKRENSIRSQIYNNGVTIDTFNFNTPNQINNPNDFKIGLDFAINRLNTGQN